MENDEILKRFEWLDNERRKDRQVITDLTEQVTSLQEIINTQKRDISNLNKDLKKSTNNLVKINEYENALSRQKVDLTKQLNDLEKRFILVEKTVESQHKDDREIFNKRVLELQNDIKSLNEIKKNIQSKGEDDFRLNLKIDELVKQLPDLRLRDDELQRLHKILEDNNRIESKRVSDLQVELSALRKRIDEERTTTDAQKEFIKKLEGQINDLTNREKIRNQEQMAFIENLSRQTVDRENLWKGWQEKIDQFDKLANNLQGQLFELDSLNREVKQSQGEFDAINQRLDRRINEITEMNRLSEERFRQEWIAFKADDQKRWTNYSLSQEESSRESDREVSKIVERILPLEDVSQRLVDSVQVINEETEKRIKSMLTVVNEFLSSYERTIGKKG